MRTRALARDCHSAEDDDTFYIELVPKPSHLRRPAKLLAIHTEHFNAPKIAGSHKSEHSARTRLHPTERMTEHTLVSGSRSAISIAALDLCSGNVDRHDLHRARA